jgi:hypothetical protein
VGTQTSTFIESCRAVLPSICTQEVSEAKKEKKEDKNEFVFQSSIVRVVTTVFLSALPLSPRVCGYSFVCLRGKTSFDCVSIFSVVLSSPSLHSAFFFLIIFVYYIVVLISRSRNPRRYTAYLFLHFYTYSSCLGPIPRTPRACASVQAIGRRQEKKKRGRQLLQPLFSHSSYCSGFGVLRRAAFCKFHVYSYIYTVFT